MDCASPRDFILFYTFSFTPVSHFFVFRCPSVWRKTKYVTTPLFPFSATSKLPIRIATTVVLMCRGVGFLALFFTLTLLICFVGTEIRFESVDIAWKWYYFLHCCSVWAMQMFKCCAAIGIWNEVNWMLSIGHSAIKIPKVKIRSTLSFLIRTARHTIVFWLCNRICQIKTCNMNI